MNDLDTLRTQLEGVSEDLVNALAALRVYLDAGDLRATHKILERATAFADENRQLAGAALDLAQRLPAEPPVSASTPARIGRPRKHEIKPIHEAVWRSIQATAPQMPTLRAISAETGLHLGIVNHVVHWLSDEGYLVVSDGKRDRTVQILRQLDSMTTNPETCTETGVRGGS